MISQLFLSVVEISLGVSAVLALLLLLSPLLNRFYAAKWKYWVWLVLAIRLLIPFNPQWPQTPVEWTLPTLTVVEDAAGGNAPSLPVGSGPENAVLGGSSTPSEEAPRQAHPVTVWDLLAILWAVGAILYLAVHLAGYRRFCKQISRWGIPVEEETVVSRVKQLAGAQWGKLPRVIQYADIASPLMTGFFHPTLVLPRTDYPQPDLDNILKHEFCHWKRGDLWYKAVLVLANALHWFNPLVFLMLRQADIDLERACDSEVIRSFDMEEKKAYSETILASIQRGKKQPTVFSTYFRGGVKTMKDRFQNILGAGKRRRGVGLFCVTVCMALMLSSLVACRLPLEEGGEVQPPVEDQTGDRDPLPSAPRQDQTVIFTGFQTTVSFYLDQVTPSSDGSIPPQGVCAALTEPNGMEPLGMEIQLPEGWELRTPSVGDAMYNIGPAAYSPVNIYRDGVCIGTMVCDAFAADPLALWEDSYVPGSVWNPPEEYYGLYWTVTCAGRYQWKNIRWEALTDTSFAGTGEVAYEGDISGTGSAQSNRGILVHDTQLMQYVLIEVREDAVTREDWQDIARSIRLFRAVSPSVVPEQPLPTEPVLPDGEGYERVELTFPAGETGGDTAPFSVCVSLPEGCTIRQPTQADGEKPSSRYASLFSPLSIYREGQYIGTIGFQAFENIPEAGNSYRAVYSGLMMGSVVSWDSQYTPVVAAEDDRFSNATTNLRYKEIAEGESAAGAADRYCPGVLGYNRELEVFVGIAFEEGSITPEQQRAIAQSLTIG